VDLHPDFRDLLAELARYEVEFAVLGGYAVGHHAKPRATKDLDLLVSGKPANLERVAAALSEFGAPSHVVAAARTMKATDVVFLGVPPVRVDILRSADGIETEAALARAVNVHLGELAIKVLSLADLIANKRAAGRPQDLADVALLERVQAKGAKT
jgi:predicted nucleotidyltransferase